MALMRWLAILIASIVCLKQSSSRRTTAAASAPETAAPVDEHTAAWLWAYTTYGWPALERGRTIKVKPKCGGKGKKK